MQYYLNLKFQGGAFNQQRFKNKDAAMEAFRKECPDYLVFATLDTVENRTHLVNEEVLYKTDDPFFAEYLERTL